MIAGHSIHVTALDGIRQDGNAIVISGEGGYGNVQLHLDDIATAHRVEALAARIREQHAKRHGDPLTLDEVAA